MPQAIEDGFLDREISLAEACALALRMIVLEQAWSEGASLAVSSYP